MSVMSEEALIPPPDRGGGAEWVRVEASLARIDHQPKWYTVYYGPDRNHARDLLWDQLTMGSSGRAVLVRVTLS